MLSYKEYMDLAYDSEHYEEETDRPPIIEISYRDLRSLSDHDQYTWVNINNPVLIPGRSLESFIGFSFYYGLCREAYQWILDNCETSDVLIVDHETQRDKNVSSSTTKIAKVGFKDSDKALMFRLTATI